MSVPAHPHFLFFHYRWPRGSHHRDRKYGYYYFYVCIVNGKLIDQSVGNSITLSNIIGIIGYAFDNKLVVAYVPLPFVTKNTNYEIKLNRVDFDSFGNVLSKCNVSVKTNCGFSFTCTPDNATYGMAKMITNLSFTIIFR